MDARRRRGRGLLEQLRVEPRAAALATVLPLGNSDRRTRNRVVTAYLDTSYTLVCFSANPSQERNDVSIICLARGATVDLKHTHMACLSPGEYAFALHDDVQKAMMIRWPELRSHPDPQLREYAAASRKQRTCAACGQVWHQTMRRCAACNEVAYCTRSASATAVRHKAACKRARARRARKIRPDGHGMTGENAANKREGRGMRRRERRRPARPPLRARAHAAPRRVAAQRAGARGRPAVALAPVDPQLSARRIARPTRATTRSIPSSVTVIAGPSKGRTAASPRCGASARASAIVRAASRAVARAAAAARGGEPGSHPAEAPAGASTPSSA